MAFSPSDEYDLNYEETKLLEEKSILLPGASRAGKRKVSGALLAAPPSGSSTGSSGASASVRHRRFSMSIDYSLELPESALSVAAVEFIGFNTEAALEIFTRFVSRPDPAINPNDLLYYIYGHVQIISTSSYQHYSSTQAMTRVGLTQSFQNAITDPAFFAIFATETLLFWIKDTLRINYLTLIQLQRRLKNYAIRHIAKKQNGSSIEGVFQPAQPPQVPQTATLSMTSEDHHLPATYVTVQNQGPVLPNHYILYKAKAASEMGEPQWIQEEGSLNMEALASYPGCDYNFGNVAWYWTPEAETAEVYRAWIMRRCPYSDTWVICIQIPKIFINTLRQQDLWYSYNWKEYVWYCKKRMCPPAKYDSYWQAGGADLIKGHICTGVQGSVTRIKKEEVQSKLTEENVLKISSGNATQWVFMQRPSVEQLGIQIRGKIHINITAAAYTQEKREADNSREPLV